MGKTLFAVALSAGMILFHPVVHALAMSEIELKSSLNQPLNAIINLTAKADELDSLNISVSRMADKSGALQHWPSIKVRLIRKEGGKNYLSITSEDVIREPVLNFLLELDWSQGRILREYSLLIDPQQ